MNARISWMAAAALLGFVAAPAQSATVCVNPNNASCEATIQDGVDMAAFGDTVNIASGFYNENVLVPVSKPGLTLKGSRGTVLDGDAPLSGVTLTVDADSVEVRGFTIRNGQSTGLLINGDDGTVRRMTITGPESDCIEINGDDAVVHGNNLRGCGSSAVLVAGDDVAIASNTISQCDSSCIDIAGDGAIVERNKMHITEDSYLIDVAGDDAEVVNNKLSNGDSEAVRVVGNDNLVSGNKMRNTEGGIFSSGQNMRITRNRGESFHGEAGISVACAVSCNSARVTNNRFDDIGDDAGGINASATAAGMQVARNIVRDVEDIGIDISGSGKITATRNQVMTSGGDAQTPCYFVSGAGAHDLENNRGSDCHGDGVSITGVGHRIHNNDFRDLIEDGVDLDSGTNVTITNNNVRDANGVGLELDNSTGTAASNNRLSGVRLGVCDEALASVLAGNTTRNADLPDQLNTAAACPVD